MLQKILSVLYFKGLPAENTLKDWGCGRYDCLNNVLFEDFMRLNLDNSSTANQAIGRATKEWEIGVDPQPF